jgi:argininosuccinate synthase
MSYAGEATTTMHLFWWRQRREINKRVIEAAIEVGKSNQSLREAKRKTEQLNSAMKMQKDATSDQFANAVMEQILQKARQEVQ